MKFTETCVKDAYLIEADRHADNRGYFQEIYSDRRLTGSSARQVNWSCSHEHVIRGIHKVPFYKLCTCVSGELWDVVVDLRPDSPTFLKWYGVWLNPETPLHLYVPPDCGHAFYAAAPNTMLIYIQGEPYNPTVEESVHYQDPTLNIEWPLGDAEYVVSDKDMRAPFLK